MRSFTERNPVVIGVVAVVVVLSGTAGALALNSGFFADRYEVQARFPDTAGLRAGDDVRVAGVRSGRVGGLREVDGQVEVDLEIDEGIELPADTRAEIVVESLLGSKHVRLVPGRDWSRLLQDRDVIVDTVTPTEVLDVQEVGVPLLEETDAAALDDLMGKVERITEGQRENVGEIIVGLTQLTEAVNSRQAEARRLIDSSRVVTGTLSDRDEQLLDALDDLDVVLDGLARRRVLVVALLQETESAARQTADLVADNRPQLDAVLEEIHLTLQVVERNQAELAASMSGMANAIGGFASVGYSGPDEVPNTWANMYTQLIGPLGPDALFGSCGLLDDAFDVLLGPDPIADCEARNGPLPTASGGGGDADDPVAVIFGPLTADAGGADPEGAGG